MGLGQHIDVVAWIAVIDVIAHAHALVAEVLFVVRETAKTLVSGLVTVRTR